MTFRRSLAVVLFAAVLAPATAQGADVRVVAREVPLRAAAAAGRNLVPRAAPAPFQLVGLHWRGPGRVWFRTASADGAWTPWQAAGPEAEDRPDRGAAEARASAGWKLGNPYWVGESSRIQYRLAGRVTRLRAFFVSSPVESQSRTTARAGRPAIVRRADWGADESIVRADPSYAESLRFAVVHHTAGTNSYTRAQSAAIVRGIQRYHVIANGWNDIGYNFLVDKYGQVFEGRGGGIDRNVVGAHALGFNTGSVGVSVLGNYEGTRISRAGRAALVKLLAWRLDVAHVDPLSRLSYTTYGNERFSPGTKVRLRAVSGHRDTGFTSCPGSALYWRLPAIARSVAATGLPKLYRPVVGGAVGGSVRFTARLSSSAAWTVTVRSGSGGLVAHGSGSGTAVDWTWDASAAPADVYTYEIAAGPAVRPATGVVPGPPPLAVSGARAVPAVITPNGDGVSERMRIFFRLNVRATVRVTVVASGERVRTLIPVRELGPGPVTARWDGTLADGSAVPDRAYRIRIAARTGNQRVVRLRDALVDRTLGFLTSDASVFSPNGDGRNDDIGFGYELIRPADVRVDVLHGRRAVRRLFTGAAVAAGPQALPWDGKLADGDVVPDARYRVRVRATTALGTRTLSRPFVVDTTRPMLIVHSARVVDGGTRIRLALGEPARLRIWYGSPTWADGDSIVVERPEGEQRVWRPVVAGEVRVVAWDAAGNRGRRIVVPVA